MIESEMGNRGSKSDDKDLSVKEQRVDGSWYGLKTIIKPYLRCILLGRESDYQTRSLSNLKCKHYSTLNSNNTNIMISP